MEAVLLAELLELKAAFEIPSRGIIVEARVDKGRDCWTALVRMAH